MTAKVGEQARWMMKQLGYRSILDRRTRLDVRSYEEILDETGRADLNIREIVILQPGVARDHSSMPVRTTIIDSMSIERPRCLPPIGGKQQS